MDEDLTVEEVIEAMKTYKPVHHVYGKYGNLAKIYLEEHNVGKFWALAGALPDYLHGIDRQADELYEAMYARLSQNPEFKRNGDYMHDVRVENQIKHIIEEEILTELVYV